MSSCRKYQHTIQVLVSTACKVKVTKCDTPRTPRPHTNIHTHAHTHTHTHTHALKHATVHVPEVLKS